MVEITEEQAEQYRESEVYKLAKAATDSVPSHMAVEALLLTFCALKEQNEQLIDRVKTDNFLMNQAAQVIEALCESTKTPKEELN